ncbi:flagellar assembly protein FliX [Falsiroseomonas ponticola]|uniref:flagellar assembly protein FliX n=1 Tax=Falsiroseomonas ponticola TaxID=2786951 RepID=UPI001932C99B|nr:flagellar assembly protein FliX [Roseomonas ponticola]
MLRVATAAPPSLPPAASRLRALRGDFGALLGAPGAESAGGVMASAGASAAAALLAIQGQDDPPPRRRRPSPQDAATRGLALLRDMQRRLLADEPPALAVLEAAAAEAESLAEEGAEARRVCAPVALRLRIEIAKRLPPDGTAQGRA